jgi:hypothetical protein
MVAQLPSRPKRARASVDVLLNVTRALGHGNVGPLRRVSGTLASMSDELRLIEKLQRIEALFSRPGTEGERVAAEKARERIMARLAEFERRDPAVEYRFRLADEWSQRLFLALFRRYVIAPYRYRGQRRTTVMARVSRSFVNDTLWPEFEALQGTLQEYFDDFTTRVIADVLHASTSDAEEREPARTTLR